MLLMPVLPRPAHPHISLTYWGVSHRGVWVEMGYLDIVYMVPLV